MSCIFCDIVARKQPAQILYEEERVLAFLDIMPVNPGHILVIPKAHAMDLWEIDAATLAALLPAAHKLAQALKTSSLRCEGLNLWMANGRCAGQTVFHAHLHVVPRFSGDGFGLRFPPHYGRPMPSPELIATAEKIKAALSTINR